MHKPHTALGLAIASALGFARDAGAALYTATLTDVTSYSINGSAAGALGSSTATWQYDDTTGLLQQAGGEFNVRFMTSPTNTLFRHSITGLLVGAGAPASATAFTCTEGNFGAGVNASICGNYRLGGNFTDESTTTWGPGTAYARTLGGDDMGVPPQPFPPQQNLAQYDNFTQRSLTGVALVIGNSACVDGVGFVCTDPGNEGVINTGFDFALTLADASPDTASTTLNTPTGPIDVLANDPGVSDPVTVSIVAAPDQGGAVAITAAGTACADPCTGTKADIRLVLTPAAPGGTPAYFETFTYQVSDGVTTATADVTVDVAESPPTSPSPDAASTGLREDGGGSALDLLLLALFGSGAVRRHRGRRATRG